MKTRRLALILLILVGVLIIGEVRLHDSRLIIVSPRWPPDLVVPAKQGPGDRPLKFVDPPMPPVPPGPTPRERNRQR
jgi:hypothetical protein